MAIAASPFFSPKAFDTTAWNGSLAGRIAHGADSLKRTVRSSTIWMSETGPSSDWRGLVWPPSAFSLVSRSKVNLMSAAVIGWPEWNLIPCRRVKSQVSGSTCL